MSVACRYFRERAQRVAALAPRLGERLHHEVEVRAERRHIADRSRRRRSGRFRPRRRGVARRRPWAGSSRDGVADLADRHLGGHGRDARVVGATGEFNDRCTADLRPLFDIIYIMRTEFVDRRSVRTRSRESETPAAGKSQLPRGHRSQTAATLKSLLHTTKSAVSWRNLLSTE